MTVELKHEGVENTIQVPEHRVERYVARGWERADGAPSADPYKGLKKPDLQKLVDDRNADRDEDARIVVGGNGTVADLIAALEADDQA